jgi:hypothetical protein
MKKTLIGIAVGFLLAFSLYEGIYWYGVAKWVDAVRIATIQQQQAQKAAQPPPAQPSVK